MVDTLDSIILLLSPTMEQMELKDLTEGLRKEGVDPALMFEVLPMAIEDVPSPSKMSGRAQQAWETVCESMSTLLK